MREHGYQEKRKKCDVLFGPLEALVNARLAQHSFMEILQK